MTLRPYRSARSDACLSKNLITQQVERMRNLNPIIIKPRQTKYYVRDIIYLMGI